ncbi:MAG: radical SAM family heme chaperone HemW [Gammaproteobacteria bacterium]|nr:radical SAM family heme chaperone HemW [Gammaproteobacteria bacterium]
MSSTNPISLYIHLPWCVRKCPYCDFNSHVSKKPIPESEYIECLIADLQNDLTRYAIARPLQTIFMGGGTPSLFSPASIAKILTAVDQHWGIPTGTEITLEANPGTVEQAKFTGFLAAGINRLSIGVQSFQDDKLKTLGRIHDGQAAHSAFQAARDAGFKNINLDLMFGLPKQSISEGLADLQTAIDLQPEHLSWYQLTLEPNTVFYKKPPILPDIDLIDELQIQGQELLKQKGYPQYEISAYAQHGRQCRHNLNYWQFGDYVGIGAGAHGKITLANGDVRRTRKLQQPESYLKARAENFVGATRCSPFLAEEKTIDEQNICFEYLLNALRLNQAIDLEHMQQRTRLSNDIILSLLQEAINREFIIVENNKIIKTKLGAQFLNNLLELFL